MTPIRIAIVAAATLSLLILVPKPSHAGCEIQARYAESIMTIMAQGTEEDVAQIEDTYLFYANWGAPTWQLSVWNRALEKIGKLGDDLNFDWTNTDDTDWAIRSFATTTFLACKAGVSI